jgi:hypothetical protein
LLEVRLILFSDAAAELICFSPQRTHPLSQLTDRDDVGLRAVDCAESLLQLVDGYPALSQLAVSAQHEARLFRSLAEVGEVVRCVVSERVEGLLERATLAFQEAELRHALR